MKILFICKHNVFRSKVAETYFNKINKNKKIKAYSGGIIKADKLNKVENKLKETQRIIAKENGLIIKQNSNSLKISLLRQQDIIVILEKDFPKSIFNNKFYLKPTLKLIKWDIEDVGKEKNNEIIISKSIKKIMKKVEKLVGKLK